MSSTVAGGCAASGPSRTSSPRRCSPPCSTPNSTPSSAGSCASTRRRSPGTWPATTRPGPTSTITGTVRSGCSSRAPGTTWSPGVAAVRATGDVSASLHHHEPGSAGGWPHNDLNPGWFADPPAGADEVRLPRDAGVDYHHGARPDRVSARETVRAVSVLFYLANEPWWPATAARPGSTPGRARTDCPPPSPRGTTRCCCSSAPRCSWHGFLSNTASPRNAVVMWLHRDRAEAVDRWQERSIVRW